MTTSTILSLHAQLVYVRMFFCIIVVIFFVLQVPPIFISFNFFVYCTGVYDGIDRAPKLLPCSHTVCVHCLTRIAAAANSRRTALDSSNNGQGSILQSQLQQDSQASQQQRQTFRCPICRELIVVPQNGGVQSLPPSFLVNQLLDLISTHRRRTLIPTCCGGGVFSSHISQVGTYYAF